MVGSGKQEFCFGIEGLSCGNNIKSKSSVSTYILHFKFLNLPTQVPNPKKKKKNHSTTVKIYSHHQIHPRQPPTPTSIHLKKNHKPPPTVVHSKIFYPYDISTPTPVPEKKKLLSPYPWLSSWPKSHQLEKKKKKRKAQNPKQPIN